MNYEFRVLRTIIILQIKKQAKPNFDLRGKTFGAIISILLAKCFNRGMCFDEGAETLPYGLQSLSQLR